jgi:hypothetical protein
MKKSRESGFAMLLVYVMAASVALMLYMELPRVAFEAQRNREEILIARGEQYTRAIQLYVRKFKKFPVKIEDLENTNQLRFLRRRYVDPMTGKDEWRLIHVGPNGQFLDSVTRKPEQQKEQKAVNTFTHESTGLGGTTAPGTEVQSAVPQMRESERNQHGRQPFGNAQGQGQQGSDAPEGFTPADQNSKQDQNQGQAQQQQVRPPVQYFGAPANPQLLIQQQGQSGQNAVGTYDSFAPKGYNPTGGPQGQTIYGGGSAGPNQQQPQQPQQAQNTFTGYGNFTGSGGQQPPVKQGGQSPMPYGPGAVPPQPGLYGQQPGAPAPGQPQQGPNPALGLIQQILTSPRPGGAPMGMQPQGQTLGGGIAGVASKLERKGIKIYNERDAYHEWEFIYDPAQEQGQAQQAGIPGAPNSPNQGTPMGSPMGTPATGNPTGTPTGSAATTAPSSSSNSFTGSGSFVGNSTPPPANSPGQRPGGPGGPAGQPQYPGGFGGAQIPAPVRPGGR